MYLLKHPDLRETPRMKGLFDFFLSELPFLRAALTGNNFPRPNSGPNGSVLCATTGDNCSMNPLK